MPSTTSSHRPPVKEIPAVCFLGQASGEDTGYTLRFYQAFTALGCRPTHLSLFDCPVANLEDLLLTQDVIYVGGGNTRSMLTLWNEWGVPAILQHACAQGTILAGLSAGANCWFAQGITDSAVADLSVLSGLGFLSGSFCPHYDGEAARRPAFHRLLTAGEIQAGYAADDGVALHFVDGELLRIVSSRPNARGVSSGVAGQRGRRECAGTRSSGSLLSTDTSTPSRSRSGVKDQHGVHFMFLRVLCRHS